ncbi:MAG TPA: twin-arginine translocation signal domain-containing protein [Burkholderiales bacterium]|nr:twin-arginine translocation signal domain-containing protein [Burkholderiales bacterium]
MKRRGFLYAAGVLAGAGALAAWRFWPEQGLWNPCLARLPRRLAEHDLVRAAWQGLDASRVWDSHAHLIGTGDSGSGIVVNPATDSLLSPAQYARRLFFLNAGCAHEAAGSVDRAYVERMRNLLDGMPAGVKLVLYAFERAHDERGAPDWEHSTFYVPDAYARDVAKAYPASFEWVASIHPYRPDALDALAWAKKEGARGVKWLPSAMGIDPASPRCDPFYLALEKNGMPLIAHAGLERAVLGREMHDYGNPLRLRRALDAGVRVVVAHCASMGEDRDLDKGENGPYVDSFSLFTRIFETYAQHCYGDISAMTQVNRAGPLLAKVIERSDWHARLLNGSDYPLPGVMPIFSVDYLVSLGLLKEGLAPILKEIRLHNPLLFDFVLKRHLQSNNKMLSASVFETRMFFMR